MKNKDQNQMIAIGSAICLLEPLFDKAKQEAQNLEITLAIDAAALTKNKRCWWHLAYRPQKKTPFVYADPTFYSNETHVLLSYLFEEFLYEDIQSKECQEFIKTNFYLQNDWLYIYQPYFDVEYNNHAVVNSIFWLRKWLTEKNLPNSDIDYLVSLSRLKLLTR